jgi:hypothetical protein
MTKKIKKRFRQALARRSWPKKNLLVRIISL